MLTSTALGTDSSASATPCACERRNDLDTRTRITPRPTPAPTMTPTIAPIRSPHPEGSPLPALEKARPTSAAAAIWVGAVAIVKAMRRERRMASDRTLAGSIVFRA